jgi:hypothetical protein
MVHMVHSGLAKGKALCSFPIWDRASREVTPKNCNMFRKRDTEFARLGSHPALTSCAVGSSFKNLRLLGQPARLLLAHQELPLIRLCIVPNPGRDPKHTFELDRGFAEQRRLRFDDLVNGLLVAPDALGQLGLRHAEFLRAFSRISPGGVTRSGS